jgi:uncharacterized protein (DUF1697 family)
MAGWIALFRGINVGGHHVLPMKALRSLLEGIGCDDVSTYIQSGNAVFRHDNADGAVLAERISGAVSREFDFKPKILLLSPEQLDAAMSSNPFRDAEGSPRTLHCYFLAGRPPRFDAAAMAAVAADDERFELKEAVFYLHAPAGIGRSRLAARVESMLGVDTTARNWRTVEKLRDLADRLPDN